MEKIIGYSYPSSTNASKFGFAKVGCFSVEILTRNSIPKALKGFATIEEARAFAETLNHPWGKYSL